LKIRRIEPISQEWKLHHQSVQKDSVIVSSKTLLEAVMLQLIDSPIFPKFEEFGIVSDYKVTSQKLWFDYIMMSGVTGVAYKQYMKAFQNQQHDKGTIRLCCRMWLEIFQEMQRLETEAHFKCGEIKEEDLMVQGGRIVLINYQLHGFQHKSVTFRSGEVDVNIHTESAAEGVGRLMSSFSRWFRPDAREVLEEIHNLGDAATTSLTDAEIWAELNYILHE